MWTLFAQQLRKKILKCKYVWENVLELLFSKWKPRISDYAEQKRLKIQEYIYARKMTLHPKGKSNQNICEISAMSAP